MKLSSVERTKATSAAAGAMALRWGLSGGWTPFRKRRKPFPAGSSFSFIRKSHSGCVKSPVARSRTPLTLAQQAIASKVMSFDVARENFEWTWRSATNFMGSDEVPVYAFPRGNSSGRERRGPYFLILSMVSRMPLTTAARSPSGASSRTLLRLCRAIS